jgi:hypothetical protein
MGYLLVNSKMAHRNTWISLLKIVSFHSHVAVYRKVTQKSSKQLPAWTFPFCTYRVWGWEMSKVATTPLSLGLMDVDGITYN